jgi:hypothetical protein
MTVLTNIERIGCFTSSKIGALAKKDRSGKGFGVPALTYIAETNMERRLGRSLTDESNARPLTWGKLLEVVAFRHLPFEYELCSDKSITHPIYPYWSGTPDGLADNTVIDIKCPITLKSFCQLVDPLYTASLMGRYKLEIINSIRENHPDGEKYYWQLVSNAILTGAQYAELVVFMPYQSELSDIKLMALDQDNAMWIANAGENDLPYLIEGNYYKNINVIRFEVPQSDKALLTDCVIEAGKLLNL